jgi:hypothetical protein
MASFSHLSFSNVKGRRIWMCVYFSLLSFVPVDWTPEIASSIPGKVELSLIHLFRVIDSHHKQNIGSQIKSQNEQL